MNADTIPIRHTARQGIILTLSLITACICGAADIPERTAAVSPEQSRVRIRYAVLPGTVTLRAGGEMILRSGGARYRVDAGEWTFEVSVKHPATQRYHVFPKTFRPGEEQARDEYLAVWRARGYTPEIEVFGMLFQTAPGTFLDNREYWISLARFATEHEAAALVAELKKESVWAWIRPERTVAGSGTFALQGQGRRSRDLLECPLEISCEAPMEVIDVSSSFWRDKKENRMFQGPLTFSIGPSGDIEVYGNLPVETYLRGVVPAEMPSTWPMEALKAQAVVARSEIYASLAVNTGWKGLTSLHWKVAGRIWVCPDMPRKRMPLSTPRPAWHLSMMAAISRRCFPPAVEDGRRTMKTFGADLSIRCCGELRISRQAKMRFLQPRICAAFFPPSATPGVPQMPKDIAGNGATR